MLFFKAKTDELDTDACVGVTMENGAGVFAQGGGKQSYELTDADVAHFTSDVSGLAAVLNTDGKAELIAGHTVIFMDGETVFTRQFVPAGGRASNPTPEKAGYRFLGWRLPDGGAFNFGAEITEDLTLAAEWELLPSLANGTVTSKEGALLILATFDADGKLTSVQTATVGKDCVNAELSTFFKTVPDSYTLMLVNGESFAPLCEAWNG